MIGIMSVPPPAWDVIVQYLPVLLHRMTEAEMFKRRLFNKGMLENSLLFLKLPIDSSLDGRKNRD